MIALELVPVAFGNYDVRHDGVTIVNNSGSPELMAARHLMALGIDGDAITVGPDGVARLRFDVAAMAASADRPGRTAERAEIANASAAALATPAFERVI